MAEQEAVRARVDTTPGEAAGWPLKRLRVAGGIVVREGWVLLMHRAPGGVAQVRLPKGQIEPGETAEAAALREVREESGLRAPRIVAPLGTVENRFAFGGERYERLETWFLMSSEEETGDPPEALDDWVWRLDWRPLDGAEAALTFPAERLALRWALERSQR